MKLSLLFVFISLFLIITCTHRQAEVSTQKTSIENSECMIDTCIIILENTRYMSDFNGVVLFGHFPILASQDPKPFICLYEISQPENVIKKFVDSTGNFSFDLEDGTYDYTVGVDGGFKLYSGRVVIRHWKFWWPKFHTFDIPYC